ncbi:MAG: MgtC/SapB family protein, partial [Gemmobacter sp.]
MDVFDLFQRLGVALAIGLLVGIERGWQLRAEAEGERTAGLRTFALSGLLGGIAAALSAVTAPVTLGLIALAYTAAFTAFHYLEASRDNNFSVTGVVAGILTFALGAY